MNASLKHLVSAAASLTFSYFHVETWTGRRMKSTQTAYHIHWHWLRPFSAHTWNSGEHGKPATSHKHGLHPALQFHSGHASTKLWNLLAKFVVLRTGRIEQFLIQTWALEGCRTKLLAKQFWTNLQPFQQSTRSNSYLQLDANKGFILSQVVY